MHVLNALMWLISNNPHFNCITINHSLLSASPENGEFPGVSTIVDNTYDGVDQVDNDYVSSTLCFTHLSKTF